eukprot:279626-Pelagomonas_calceolata.AAC.3
MSGMHTDRHHEALSLCVKAHTLLDGDKRANVQPSFGIKLGCPLSPLLFSIYLDDIDCLAEGVQGALTGIPNFM